MKFNVKQRENLDFKKIEPILWNMQCELRNKEGITGINAMHHINLILLIRTLDKKNCNKFGVPEDLCFENIKDLSQNDLFDKVYNRNNINGCLLKYIRDKERFGFGRAIPFEINNQSTLHYLIVKVQEIDTKYFFENTDLVGDIYESFINREGKTMKDLGQYFTDRQLIDYLVKLCDPKVIDGKIESIYDGASGTGGFLTQAIKYLNNKNKKINWETNRHNIYGTDINRNTFALLKLNMYFTTGQIIDNLEMKDTLRTESLKVDGYDNILMNPPFGIKGLKYTDMNSKIKALGINGTKGEILFLQNCMANLAINGRCVIVVPDGVLFNSTKMYKETRKYLLNNFKLEKIIKVGDGAFFKNTGVKTAVLFFKNTGESTKQVEFVQVNKVENKIEEIPLMKISIEKIIENDYSLNMNMYKEVVINSNINFINVSLRELFKLESGTIQATKSIPGEFQLVSQSFKNTHNTYKYEGHNLFISGCAPIGKIYYYYGKCVCSTILSHLKPLQDFNIKYMYYYLKKNEYILKENCECGSANKGLDIEAFLNIKIPLPPIEIQQRIVEQLDNIYENEIENSKKTIEGLEKSIESIMNNTCDNKLNKLSNLKNECTFRKGIGITKSNRTGGNIPYYCSNGHSGHSYMNKYNIDGKFILLAEDGNIGSIHFIEDGTKIWVGDHVHIINPNNNLDIKYLYWFLKYNVSYELFTTGSVIPKLNKHNLEKISIYLPPIEIQEKILEECNSKEKLINFLKDNIIQSERQANEIMDSLFTP